MRRRSSNSARPRRSHQTSHECLEHSPSPIFVWVIRRARLRHSINSLCHCQHGGQGSGTFAGSWAADKKPGPSWRNCSAARGANTCHPSTRLSFILDLEKKSRRGCCSRKRTGARLRGDRLLRPACRHPAGQPAFSAPPPAHGPCRAAGIRPAFTKAMKSRILSVPRRSA